MLYHPTELVKSQDVIVRVGSIAWPLAVQLSLKVAPPLL